MRRPWTWAAAVALPLTALYLILAPPAADLAAATYRSDVFARAGFSTWDTGWYAAHGHWLPGYSLLSPALGALLGVRVLLSLSALTACVLFALVAERAFARASARAAAVVFALGVCVGTLSGRVPYELGVALGLGSVLALTRGWLAVALALAVLTSLASPVAGAFLALAAVAHALADRRAGEADRRAGEAKRRRRAARRRRARRGWRQRSDGAVASATAALTVAAGALISIATLSIAYPESGYEPFAPSAFWPALLGVVLFAALLSQGSLGERGRRTLRVGAVLYALALIGAYVVHTPMGGNAARLGPLLAAPLLAGLLWERQRTALALLAPALLYWQLVTPVRDTIRIAGDPSVNASYYAPLLAGLAKLDSSRDDASRSRLRDGAPAGEAAGPHDAEAAGPHDAEAARLYETARPHEAAVRATIVEVPMTSAHWEAAYLAGAILGGHRRIALARGWERQLDTRYAPLFYRSSLAPSAYRAWLAQNRVAYVALPDAPLDRAGRLEGRLIAAGAPYLRLVWRSRHWRLYRFIG